MHAQTISTPELLLRWQQNHDEAAREELVERFMPLTRKLARRYAGAGEPFEDLLQVASYGLLKAMERFDPQRGTAFSSFAVPTILGELKRYFRDLGWSVHVPRAAQELALKVQNTRKKLAAGTGRSPTVQEVAQFAELSVEQVLDGMEAGGAHHALSFELPRDETDGEGGTLGDTFGEEDPGFEFVEEHAAVTAAIKSLTPRERRVLTLRYYGEMTQSEIAQEVGVSQMQISRILRRATARLTDLTSADAGQSETSKSSSAPDISRTRRACEGSRRSRSA